MSRRLSPILAVSWFSLLGAALPAHAASSLANADELLQWLVKGLSPVGLIAREPERGCGPKECTVDWGDLAVLKTGGLRPKGGRSLTFKVHQQQNGGAPGLDWDALAAYTVLKTGHHDWGVCLDFAHEGVGKSGTHQRWTTTVLVPRVGGKLGPVAHRFTGYWSSCHVLADAGKEEAVLLPVLEQGDGPGRLQLVWYRCEAQQCTATLDRRSILPLPSSDSGALLATGEPGQQRQ